MDAARPDDDEQAVVLAVEDRVDLRAAPPDDLGVAVGQDQLVEQRRRRHERLDPLDPLIADVVAGLA